MPRKKSGKKAARKFRQAVARIETFTREIDSSNLGDQAVSWAYEAALIKTAVAFEQLMLDCIVAAINNDTATISARTGTPFPSTSPTRFANTSSPAEASSTSEAGTASSKRSRATFPQSLATRSDQESTAQGALDRIIALRNFAAHESSASKRKALDAIGQQKIAGAGSWIKCQGRFSDLTTALTSLANEIETKAPY